MVNTDWPGDVSMWMVDVLSSMSSMVVVAAMSTHAVGISPPVSSTRCSCIASRIMCAVSSLNVAARLFLL